MELIDKSAVVEEIYRLRDFANDRWDIEEVNGVDKFLDKLIPYINILEVKDVDLDKEIHDMYKRDNSTLKIEEQYAKIAKHFFELGLKTQKE